MKYCGDCQHLRLVDVKGGSMYMCAYTPNLIKAGGAIPLVVDDELKPMAVTGCPLGEDRIECSGLWSCLLGRAFSWLRGVDPRD